MTKREFLLWRKLYGKPIFLSLPSKDEVFVLTANIVVIWIVILIMVLVLIFEDKLNGFIAKKRMLTGMEKTIVTFKQDTYISENTIGKYVLLENLVNIYSFLK